MKTIGFVGTGVMGKSMVRNLMKKGYEVAVYNRTRAKAQELLDEGALWCEDVKTCAAGRDAVITIVGFPKDVEEVYFGEGGIIANADAGTVLIDMTTTSPRLSVKIYEQAKQKGLSALDAPVSGGDTGARNGTLSIMVGGDKETFETCLPVFQAMGTTILYEGQAGTGQHTKMANQIAIAGAVAGVCEAMAYGKTMGLDLQTMLDSIGKGAAGSWQMTNNGAKILKEDYAPGFFIKHYIKDMNIASEESEDVGLHLGVLEDVLEMYRALEKKGLGELGTQALFEYYK